MKSKIHRAKITQADLNYEGSISIDRDLLDKVGLIEFEKVEIYNINNGERFATYVIYAGRGSGIIGLNGAAARKGQVGDRIIIASYALIHDDVAQAHSPKIIVLNEDNSIKDCKAK